MKEHRENRNLYHSIVTLSVVPTFVMPSQQLRVIVDVTFVNWPPPSASPLVPTKSFAKRQKLFIRHVFLGTSVGGQFVTNTAYVTIILLVFLYTAATKTFTITSNQDRCCTRAPFCVPGYLYHRY